MVEPLVHDLNASEHLAGAEVALFCDGRMVLDWQPYTRGMHLVAGTPVRVSHALVRSPTLPIMVELTIGRGDHSFLMTTDMHIVFPDPLPIMIVDA